MSSSSSILIAVLLAAVAVSAHGPPPPGGPGGFGPPPPGGPGGFGPPGFGPRPGGPGGFGPPPPPGAPGGAFRPPPFGPPPPFPGGPFPGGPPQVCPPSSSNVTGQQNLAIIKDFYNEIFVNKNVENAANKYMGQNVVEHNPDGGDGIADFKATMTFLTTNSPGQVTDIKRIVAQGDLVMVHGSTTWLGQDVAFVDIYRLENGKIVEHWDVIQNIPVNPKNPHAMF